MDPKDVLICKKGIFISLAAVLKFLGFVRRRLLQWRLTIWIDGLLPNPPGQRGLGSKPTWHGSKPRAGAQSRPRVDHVFTIVSKWSYFPQHPLLYHQMPSDLPANHLATYHSLQIWNHEPINLHGRTHRQLKPKELHPVWNLVRMASTHFEMHMIIWS